MKSILVSLLLAFPLAAVSAPGDVTFPPPIRSGGLGLFSVLQARQETRLFDDRLLHWEVLGHLLWAACGINRPDDGSRTIALPSHVLAFSIHLLAEEGVWQYDAVAHRLTGTLQSDLRDIAVAQGQSTFDDVFIDAAEQGRGSKLAPVVLVIAARSRPLGFDLAAPREVTDDYHIEAALQAGQALQNLHLAAISQGVGFLQQQAPVNAGDLATRLGLTSARDILQIVQLGYPAAQ